MENTCPRCGSTKIVPDLPLYADVRSMEAGGSNRVDSQVQGIPGFWSLTADAVQAGLIVRVCGECGHAEIHAHNHRLLYEKYEKLRQS